MTSEEPFSNSLKSVFDLSFFIEQPYFLQSKPDNDDVQSFASTSRTSLESSLHSPCSLESFASVDEEHAESSNNIDHMLEDSSGIILKTLDPHSSDDNNGSCLVSQLRRKRAILEDWHNQQQKVKETYTGEQSTIIVAGDKNEKMVLSKKNWLKTHRISAFPFSLHSGANGKSKRMKKGERQRYQRIIDQLQQARCRLLVRHLELRNQSDRFVDTRSKIRANKERAATKLRISQVDMAIEYYQQRICSDTSVATAVPMDILKVVSSLADLTKQTLRDDLDHALALLCDQHPEDLRRILAMVNELRMTGIEKSGLVVGESIPHFKLMSSTGKFIDSRLLSRHGKTIFIVYLGHWSTLCVATLRAWRDHYKLLLRNARGVAFPVIAIGTETKEGCQQTSAKTGCQFPILSDPTGEELIRPLGLLIGQEHPMTLLHPSKGESPILPLTATLVVDNNTRRVLYSHVTIDMAKRAEPMDIVSSFFVDCIP